MPRPVRLYLRQIGIGFGAAAVVVVLLLGFNIAGLRHRVEVSADAPLAVFLLWLLSGIVLSAVTLAIMQMAGDDRDDDDDDLHGGPRARDLVPVRVRR